MSNEQCPFCAGTAITTTLEPGIETTKFVCRSCGHSWFDIDDTSGNGDDEEEESNGNN